MSLIILTLDREKKTHSIYCDGLTVSGGQICKTNSNKIAYFNTSQYSILLGTTGSLIFTRYFRVNFEEQFRQSDVLQNLSNTELSCEKIKVLISSIWKKFCEVNRISLDNSDFSDFGCVMSINGHLYNIDYYRCGEINTFDVYEVNDRDYHASGQDDIAAMCLLENNIEPQKIFDTISKFNCHINNIVHSIENISYLNKFNC